jgi:hypothetical protein
MAAPRAEAREDLRAARDMFGRFGAAPFAERARRELRHRLAQLERRIA